MVKEQEIKDAFYSQHLNNFIEWLKYRGDTIKISSPDGSAFLERGLKQR